MANISPLKLINSLLLVLIIIGTTIWSILAIYLGNSETNIIQTSIAAIFGFTSVLTLILNFTYWRKYSLISYFSLFIMVLIWWCLAINPSNERQWQTDVSKLAYADINGDKITVHNIRNFSYRSELDYIPAYYNKTFDLTKLTGVDLFAVYWMGDAIAHTMISFNFSDNDYLAVSIEARKEQNESYSTFKGFFRQYELIYIVADERDVVGLRTNYRKNPPEQVYLYRLKPNKENARRFFLEYLKRINDLHDQAQFYNTLLDNCTTSIWFNALVNDNHIPFSWKILLSGYVPEYLYDSGRLESQLPFEQLKQQAIINPIAEKLDLSSSDFSNSIRKPIENKP